MEYSNFNYEVELASSVLNLQPLAYEWGAHAIKLEARANYVFTCTVCVEDSAIYFFG